MSESGYLNFDLEIERAGQHYGVQVLSSPAGEARAEIESSVLTQIDSAATPQAIGEQLYEAIFRDEIGTSLRRSLDEAHRQQKGLRIRLRLADAPELTNLPWEYLYDRSRDTFLALSSETPLVRYLDLPEPPREPAGRAEAARAGRDRQPGRVSAPGRRARMGQPQDSAPRSGSPRAGGDRPADAAFHRSAPAPTAPPGIPHPALPGHGSFDAEANDSVLLLQDEAGQPQVITGQHFSTLLRDHCILCGWRC